MDLERIPAVDQHCHPLWRDWNRRFRESFSESTDQPILADHLPMSLGYLNELAALAELFGCESEEAAVLAARGRLGFAELLQRANVKALLVDDGDPQEALPLSDMERLAGVSCWRILRIESVAQAALSQSQTFEAFEEGVSRELLAQPAIALKSILAYRAGLDVRSADRGAAVAMFDAMKSAGLGRIIGHALEDWLLDLALGCAERRGLPVQFHCGWGDADEDLRLANPLFLRPIILAHPELPLVLLHCYPYQREAAYLAAVHANVYVDLSLTIPHAAWPERILAETLELCPVSKLLYASDALGIPERFWLGAHFWRQALTKVLPDDELAGLVLHGNAERLYKLQIVLPAPQ